MQALKTGSISPDALQSPIKRRYIIKIYQAITKIYLAHGSYHQASKYHWSIAEPEIAYGWIQRTQVSKPGRQSFIRPHVQPASSLVLGLAVEKTSSQFICEVIFNHISMFRCSRRPHFSIDGTALSPSPFAPGSTLYFTV